MLFDYRVADWCSELSHVIGFDMDNVTRVKRSASPLPNSTEIEVTAVVIESKSICFTTTALYRELRSLLLSLSFGGLIFKKDFNATGIQKHLHRSHAYSIVILIVLVSNVLRWFTMFRGDETFGSGLFFEMAECIWGMECIGHYIACIIACEYYDRLPGFFVEWDKLQKELNWNSTKLFTNLCTALLWFFICIHFGFNVYLLYWTDMYEYFLTPWGRDFQYAIVIEIIGLILHVYLIFAWFAPSVLMFIICRTIARQFKQVTREVIILPQVEFLAIAERFEGIRRRHQKLCNVVTRADNIFSMHIAISLSSSVIIACFVMYIIAYDDNSDSSKTLAIIIQLYWLVSILAKLILDCVSGAILNDAVSLYCM